MFLFPQYQGAAVALLMCPCSSPLQVLLVSPNTWTPARFVCGAGQTELHNTTHLCQSQLVRKIMPSPTQATCQGKCKNQDMPGITKEPLEKQTQFDRKVSYLCMCKLIEVIHLYWTGNEGIGLGFSIWTVFLHPIVFITLLSHSTMVSGEVPAATQCSQTIWK